MKEVYCSWCYQKSTPKLIEQNLFRRNIYQCPKCNFYTVECRFCHNMARDSRGFEGDETLTNQYKKWSDELCSQHDGTINSFLELYSDHRYPRLEQLHQHAQLPFFTIEPDFSPDDPSKPSIFFISGFLNQGKQNRAPFSGVPVYGKIYEIDWKSCNIAELKKTAVSSIASRGLTLLFNNPWHSALIEARRVGVSLANFLSRSGRDNFVLIGHSLGARVIFNALQVLAAQKKKIVSSVYLFGGAVDNEAYEWEFAAKAVQNNIYNFYSKNDQILSKLYQFSSLWLSDPIGLSKIESQSAKIKNFDVSDLIGGHTEYKENAATLFEMTR